jgi:restriction endonuclease Mrr
MVLSRFPKNCWRPDRDDITTSSGTTSFLNTSTANSGQSVGQIGDAGIDDIIDQGALGLDRVYIQSKRYAIPTDAGGAASYRTEIPRD